MKIDAGFGSWASMCEATRVEKGVNMGDMRWVGAVGDTPVLGKRGGD